MELYDESTLNKNNKNKKLANILLVLIVLTIFIIVALLALMVTIKKDTLTVSLNGNLSENLKSLLIFEENNSKIYIPIKEVANLFGYNSYNGDYEQPSEDISKCYIQSENEVASFSLDSNVIYKLIPNTNSDYEYFQIDEELYTTIDGIQKAFNVSFDYDKNSKTITVYTLEYLTESYSKNIINFGYTGIDSSFNNQKAILDNMLVVEKDKKYGVIDLSTREVLLDTKYDEIKYLQQTSDFLVTSNKKVGIISKDKQTKVNISYDNIQLIDNEDNLYIITQDGKYGLIDINGNIKIYPEYDQIGVETSDFKYNNIKNGYILLNKLIPVKKGNLWGLFDKSGNQVVDFKYDELGYIKSSSQIANNLLAVPEYDVIVVKKDDKYNLITLNGREVFNVYVDSIYMNIESGNTNYYMVYNEQTNPLSKYLDNTNDNKTNTNTNTNVTSNSSNDTSIDENNTNV